MLFAIKKKTKEISSYVDSTHCQPSLCTRNFNGRSQRLKNQLELMQLCTSRASQFDSLIDYLIKVIVAFDLKIDFSFLVRKEIAD